MFEILLKSQLCHPYKEVVVNTSPMRFTVPVDAARTRSVSAYHNGKIFIGGGYASGNLYPPYNCLMTLSADGKSVVSSTTPTGYLGSNPTGVKLNNALWVGRGHDGTYPRVLNRVNLTTGALEFTSRESIGTGRDQPTVRTLDGDTLIWGGGYTGSIIEKDYFKYKISTNTWTKAFDLPIVNGVQQTDHTGLRGDFHYGDEVVLGFNEGPLRLTLYNKINGNLRFIDLSKAIDIVSPGFYGFKQYVSGAIFGEYLFIFAPVTCGSRKAAQGCWRINLRTEEKELLIFENITARLSPSIAVDESKGFVYMIGGVEYYDKMNLGWQEVGNMNKPTQALIFTFDQLTANYD